MTGNSKTVSPPPVLRQRRLLLLLLVLVLVTGAGGLAAWWRWREAPIPPPPEISAVAGERAVVQVLEALRAKVLQQPRSGRAWGLLGQVLLAHDFGEAALVCFAQAQRFDSGNPRWPYYQGLILVDRDPDRSLPLLQQAADLCDSADPDNTAPRLRLAEELLQQDHLDQAEAQFWRVLGQEQNNPRARFGLGLVALAKGDLPGARVCLERCGASPRARQKAAAALATVLQRLGQATAAAAAQRRAQELPRDGDWVDPYANEYGSLVVSRKGRLNRAQMLRQEGRYSEALALLRELVREAGDYPCYLDLGLTLLKTQDLPHAEAALREATRLAPDKFEAAYVLSILLVDQATVAFDRPETRPRALEQFREANRYARRAVALKPDDAYAHMFLGLALKGLSQRPEAIQHLRTSVRLLPQTAEPYLSLAEALAEQGQKEEARRLLEQASGLARPDDKVAKKTLERVQKALAKP